jgi:methylated-DNA-[protein]-cysteine S-methyltransferase
MSHEPAGGEAREAVVDSPVGRLWIVASRGALTRIDFLGSGRAPAAPNATHDAILDLAITQLNEYFDGQRREFSVPLAPRGTAFQMAVWDALLEIPFGGTTTYGSIAKTIGRPAAIRAVGAANGANPIPILIPCHRVVGSDGSLTGFGGGIDNKRLLLALEGVVVDAERQRALFAR